jgi:hypothetical protein
MADMRIRTSALLAASAVSLALVSASPAHAQATTVIVQGQPQPQPGPAYPPGYAPGYAPGYGPAPAYPPGAAPGPVYTTPIYQQTQPSYIPQSVAFSGPRVINDWSEGEPIPPGYHESTRIRRGLVIGGAVLFGTTYLLSALVGSIAITANDDCQGCSGSSLGALLIPAVGPFVAMGNSGNTALGDFWLAFDGLLQVGGITMFAVGIAAPKTVLVRNDLGSNQGIHLSLAPIVAPGRQGMGVIGTF